jgi:hypothetical protein
MRFIKNHKLLLALLIASTVILSSFAATSAWAADKLKVDPTHREVPYRILCISSYNYSFAIVPQQLDGLKDGLKAVPVDIDYEFMDTAKCYIGFRCVQPYLGRVKGDNLRTASNVAQ